MQNFYNGPPGFIESPQEQAADRALEAQIDEATREMDDFYQAAEADDSEWQAWLDKMDAAGG